MPSLLRRFVSDFSYTPPPHHSPTHGHPTLPQSTNSATSSMSSSNSYHSSASSPHQPDMAPIPIRADAGGSISASSTSASSSGDDGMLGNGGNGGVGGVRSAVNVYKTLEGEEPECPTTELPTKSFQIRFVYVCVRICWRSRYGCRLAFLSHYALLCLASIFNFECYFLRFSCVCPHRPSPLEEFQVSKDHAVVKLERYSKQGDGQSRPREPRLVQQK